MDGQSPLLPIAPTRVRRNYRGGLLLDRLEGLAAPADSDRPESWLASTVGASNPGMPAVPGEGLTRLVTADGSHRMLASCIERAPEYHLGARHVRHLGTELGFLAKLLDSAMRLHVQAHPTAAFARRHIGSPFGKLEVYYVLAVREGCEGYIRLGFQRPPTPTEWKGIILAQDIAAMDSCFDRIPVHPGEVWIVPGGLPHAIGEGVLMVEVMEPSDLVVRCEFEREGVVVPPAGRFMGRDLDFCLRVFDYTAYSPDEIRQRSLLAPTPLRSGHRWQLDRLVGAERTSCFEIQRLRGCGTVQLPTELRCAFAIQTAGSATLRAGNASVTLAFGQACFVAAAAGPLECDLGPTGSELVFCRPNLP